MFHWVMYRSPLHIGLMWRKSSQFLQQLNVSCFSLKGTSSSDKSIEV